MVTGCYQITVYCDHPGCKKQETFYGKDPSAAFEVAKDVGWKVKLSPPGTQQNQNNNCRCPGHNKDII